MYVQNPSVYSRFAARCLHSAIYFCCQILTSFSYISPNYQVNLHFSTSLSFILRPIPNSDFPFPNSNSNSQLSSLNLLSSYRAIRNVHLEYPTSNHFTVYIHKQQVSPSKSLTQIYKYGRFPSYSLQQFPAIPSNSQLCLPRFAQLVCSSEPSPGPRALSTQKAPPSPRFPPPDSLLPPHHLSAHTQCLPPPPLRERCCPPT